ncbi:hypothetical protein ACA910_012136 [Epithemia clementina (nom. ined.)]
MTFLESTRIGSVSSFFISPQTAGRPRSLYRQVPLVLSSSQTNGRFLPCRPHVWNERGCRTFPSSARSLRDDPDLKFKGLAALPRGFTSQVNGHSKENHQNRLEALQQELDTLNGGLPLNVNSHKQVSLAIFGYHRSVSKQALLEASQTLDRVEQQQLARKVLEYKELQRQQERMSSILSGSVRTTTVREFSSSAPFVAAEVEDEADDMFAEEEQDDEDIAVFIDDYAQSSFEDKTIWDSAEELEEEYSQYVAEVNELFNASDCKISSYWQQPLLEVSRPAAQALVRQLDSTKCPLGFDPSASPYGNSGTTSKSATPGSFVKFCQYQKMKFPDCVILTRCGDFYETYGVDAVMLVEHVGLNPMGEKAKAGCPKGNIQATLDRLTSAGFSTAVYEESGALTGNNLKQRYLTQIVSPASPTYLYELTMKDSSREESEHIARPYVGVLSLAAGYTLVEVRMDDLTVRIFERLTSQAVACHLAVHTPAGPIWYVPGPDEYKGSGRGTLPFLPNRHTVDGGPRDLRVAQLNPSLLPAVQPGQAESDRARELILSQVIAKGNYHTGVETRVLTSSDFTTVEKPVNDPGGTNALQLETAIQLGLLADKAFPSLLYCVLPPTAPKPAKEMVHRWLLTPPPPDVSDAIADLVKFAQRSDVGAFPPMPVPSVGRLLTLLRTGQARASVYGEIWSALTATCRLVPLLEQNVAESLLKVVEYETGLSCNDVELLRMKCEKAAKMVGSVIAQETLECPGTGGDPISTCNAVPLSFVIQNESSWRRRVRQQVIPEIYEKVEKAATLLDQAILKDFFHLTHFSQINPKGPSPVVQLRHDNGIALKEIPKGADKSNYIPRPYQKRKYYTTSRVEKREKEYLKACADAYEEVEQVLRELSRELQKGNHMPAIIQAAHSSLIFSIVLHHARKAKEAGWQRASVNDLVVRNDKIEYQLYMNGVWPYWMNHYDAVSNTIDLKGMWVLTAPNMSGKSTLMRAVAAAALLSVCGFCAPVGGGSYLHRFDNLFVRGASADVPAEGKSAFGAEMVDVASMLSSCGSRSLVFVDELGRGTSPRDGTRIAGAILEEMAVAQMTGIFATHLHDILDLPLKGQERMSQKRMAVRDENQANGSAVTSNEFWTYLLEDGVCRDSMALVTAAQFGVPSKVLQRAEYFLHHWHDQQSSFPNSSEVYKSGREEEDGEVADTFKNDPDQDTILALAEELTGQKPVADVPANWIPPPHLQGKSCLYILKIPRDGQERSLFYVGETDKFEGRLKKHRQNFHRMLSSHVFEASDKSQAREWETRLIRAGAKAGIPLISTKDGLN